MSITDTPARFTDAALLDALRDAGADVSKPRSIRCPFHPDAKPSSGIFQGDDKAWRFKCQACGDKAMDFMDVRNRTSGQSAVDIARSVMGDNTPPPPPPRKPKPTYATQADAEQAATNSARYERDSTWDIAHRYAYPGGFVVLRFEPPAGDDKTFRPIYANGTGWSLGDPPGKLPLYRGDVIADGMVLVVEGEKAADAAASIGINVVAASHGSNAADKTDWSPLAGRDVVIWPDHDDNGQKYAAEVAGILAGQGCDARIMQIPDGLSEKDDAADWIDQRDAMLGDDIKAGIEEMIRAAPATDVPRPKTRKLLMRLGNTIDDDGTTYLWRRRFASGSINIVFSRPGAGKSTIAANLTGHVTTGQAWPDGAPCERGNVIYIKGEGTDASIRDRMKHAGADATKYAIVGRAEAEDDESPMIDLGTDDANLLDLELRRFGDVKLIIVDTLDSLYPSMRMIDNANIRKCLWPMQELAERHGVCIIILAHTNKGGYHDPLDRLSGGRAIGGAARSVWYLGREDREEDVHYLASVKVNDFRPEPTIAYTIIGSGPDMPGAIRWGDASELSAWDLDNPPKGEGRSKTEACVEWMQDRLASGPELLDPFRLACEAAGFGDHCYKKARRELGIESKAGKGSVPPKYWACLPGQKPQVLMTPTTPTLDIEQLSNVGVVKG